MRRAIYLLLLLNLAPATAEMPNPLNWFTRKFAGRPAAERLKHLDPVWRSARVPLMDVRSCADQSACVIVNGRRVELEATPTDLWHQRVRVIGVARGGQFTSVFAKVRFSPWSAAEPDYLLIWASVRNQTRKVVITGYGIDRDDRPGTEYQPPIDFTDYSVLKYLTSRNVLETEVAREMVERKVFCTSYPAEPVDTIRDEVAPLQRANLLNTPEAAGRLAALETVADVLDIARGKMMCDSPLTDHVDAVLEQVREALEAHARRAPAPTVTPKSPKIEVVPKAPAAAQGETP